MTLLKTHLDNRFGPKHLQIYAEKYAQDQETFFKDYAEAHAKLSNLGAKFNPPEVNNCIMFKTRM